MACPDADDLALFVEQDSPERGGDVHGLQGEGHKKTNEIAFPGGRRKDKGNKALEQFFVVGEKRKILDGAVKLRHLVEHLPKLLLKHTLSIKQIRHLSTSQVKHTYPTITITAYSQIPITHGWDKAIEREEKLICPPEPCHP